QGGPSPERQEQRDGARLDFESKHSEPGNLYLQPTGAVFQRAKRGVERHARVQSGGGERAAAGIQSRELVGKRDHGEGGERLYGEGGAGLRTDLRISDSELEYAGAIAGRSDAVFELRRGEDELRIREFLAVRGQFEHY